MTPYENINLGQYWLRWWLVVWTNVDLSSEVLCAIPQALLNLSIGCVRKLHLLKLLPHLPGANELIALYLHTRATWPAGDSLNGGLAMWKWFSEKSIVMYKSSNWHHYGNVTWASWHLKLPVTQLFIQQVVQAKINKNVKSLHYWPFVRGIYW